MVAESLAIIALISVTAVMYLKAGKKNLALLTLPFLFLPGMQLLSLAIYGIKLFSADFFIIKTSFVLIGAVVGFGLCLFLSRRLPFLRMRLGYLIFSGAFSVALAVAFIISKVPM